MSKILSRPYNPGTASTFEKAGFSPAIARVLAARGIDSEADLKQDWSELLSPQLLTGTQVAAHRLADAFEKKEHITIVGDYDCDGATASAVGVRGLRLLGFSCDYFVPDRVANGYGLSVDIIEALHEKRPDTSLIVTVDNGISSIQAIDKANELGIDVIVTDHHLQGAQLPKAVAIVNPNCHDCQFPSKNLAGVGVIFYVLLALRAQMRERGHFTTASQPRLDALVDLVALGTIADVVKLDKNNRILVAQGLKRIRAGAMQPGLNALFSVSGRDYTKATTRDFGFAIGPRINAAGRMGSMNDGINCLLADTFDEALCCAQGLNNTNDERRELEEEMQHLADASVENLDLEKTTSVTLFNEAFPEGVVGLIASRLKERIHRPVIAFALTEKGELKGSGRSIAGIHLRDMLDLVDKAAPGLIVRFGGHAMAAGLTIAKEDFQRFGSLFDQVIRDNTDERVFEHIFYTDGPLAPDELNESLVNAIDEIIWGQGFDLPVFSNDVEVTNQLIIKGAHLKLEVKIGSRIYDAIFFKHTQALPPMVKLAYRPSINDFRGRRSIQLIVQGIESI